MPAELSSPIPATLAPLAHADPLRPADTPQLLAYLATIHDPRRASGRRHPLTAILAMAAAAVLTGARSVAAIAEWAADAPQPVRAALGARREGPNHWVVPAEATIRRTLQRLDPTTLAAVLGTWLADRDRPAQRQQRRRRAVAVDGKTLRAPSAATAGRSICSPRWTTPPARSWPNAASTAPRARSQAWCRCWPTWTLTGWSSPRTRCTPTPTPPSTW